MAITNLGTQVLIGFGDSGQYCISGYIPDDVSLQCFADIQTISDCDNEITAKLISNHGERITVNAIVKQGTAAEDIHIGDTITINSINWMVESREVKYSRTEAKIALTAVKEDSMSYT